MPQLNKQTIFIYEEAVLFLELLFFIPIFSHFYIKNALRGHQSRFLLKKQC